MTAENLMTATDFVVGGDYTVSIALAQYDTDDDVPVFRRLNISDEVANGLRVLAQDSVNTIASQQRHGHLRVAEYNPEYNPDKHEIDYVAVDGDPIEDLLDVPSPAHIPLIGDGDVEAFVDGVRFNVLILSKGPHRVVLFRRYSPNKELSRSRYLITRFLGERLESIDEPMFQFDPNFDMLLYRRYLYIRSRANFEHILRYYEQLEVIAGESLATIGASVPIANFDEFRESCLGHLQKLKKLRNISQKPYLEHITVADLRRTIDGFGLDVEIDENDELVFDPNDRWAILQLLDDAYLGSEMTGLHYETNSKREV